MRAQLAHGAFVRYKWALTHETENCSVPKHVELSLAGPVVFRRHAQTSCALAMQVARRVCEGLDFYPLSDEGLNPSATFSCQLQSLMHCAKTKDTKGENYVKAQRSCCLNYPGNRQD